MTSPEAVICEPLRTPVGRLRRRVSATCRRPTLAATVSAELVARTGIGAGDVDDVILGQCYPNGEAPAIGRIAALDAGLPRRASPGCSSTAAAAPGLQAVIDAAMQVQTGAADLVLAGGVESMSQVEHYAPACAGVRRRAASQLLGPARARPRVTAGGRDHPVPGGMLETAENLRREYGITREEQDELALRSHQRAVAAQQDGRFADEIVPVDGARARGAPTSCVDTDEHPRADTSLERLAALRPVHRRDRPRVDRHRRQRQRPERRRGALHRHHPRAGRALGPAAAGRGWSLGGRRRRRPSTMGIGPVPATAGALERAGLDPRPTSTSSSSTRPSPRRCWRCTREWGFDAADFERLNVNGSGISLGHPVGRDRRPHPGDAAARDGRRGAALRAGDDVHRRRPGPRRGLRAGRRVSDAEPTNPVEPGPLAGTIVLDLTHFVAGPYCTMLLADHGADVIKIERPGGEPTRHIAPKIGPDGGGISVYFARLNRNKRSVCLDLRTDDGRAVLRDLVTHADVLVENFRAGALADLGFDADTLLGINPRSCTAASRDSVTATARTANDRRSRRWWKQWPARCVTTPTAVHRSPWVSLSATSPLPPSASAPSRWRCSTAPAPAAAVTSTCRCTTRCWRSTNGQST